MEKVSKEILQSLRGRQSARAFSQKLGYASNQFSRWESGHSRFSWLDFVDLCQRLKAPLTEVWLDQDYGYKPENISHLLKFIAPKRSANDIAKICRVSPLTVKRWNKEDAIPSADMIFQLCIFCGTPLSPLLNRLFQQRKMTARLKDLIQQMEVKIGAVMERPWTIAILCLCMRTDLQGQSVEGVIKNVAKKIDIDQAIVADTVYRLMRVRIIGYSKEDSKFYLCDEPTHFEFSHSYNSFCRGLHFWLKYSDSLAQKLTKPSTQDIHAYLVFNGDADDIKLAKEKTATLYRDLVAIRDHKKSAPTDRTVLFYMGLNYVDTLTFGDLVKAESKK
jgi:transcriptional regulator with XRE-family HTH domain